MQDGGEGLVDQEAQGGVDEALDQGEGGVEHDQAFQQTVDRGTDGLVHPQDGVDGHEVGVNGIGHIVVEGDGEEGHDDRADQHADERALAGLHPAVEESGGDHEAGAQQEVAQLTSTGGGGDHQVDQVLHQADHRAVDRAKGESGQQSGQLRNIHLDKAGDQGDREVQEHQHKGDGREHSGHGEGADAGQAAAGKDAGGGVLGVGHKKTLLFASNT